MPTISVKVLIPKANWLVVRADPVEKVTQVGGINLPDAAIAAVVKRTGLVVATGEDCVRAVVGMRVLFSAHMETTVEVNGEELELMMDQMILAEVG